MSFVELCYMRKRTLEEMHVLAAARNGKCISRKYVNVRTRLKWECQNSHRWVAKPNVIQQGSWCPVCANVEAANKNRFTIKHAQGAAKKHGGECLSKEYVSARSRLRWKCASGHEWETSYAHINNGTWCPYCSGHCAEELCRFILESLTLRKFPKDKRSLANLELDGHCRELKVAFEYNGEQHYHQHKHWHKGKQDLYKQQKRDQLKSELCDMNGINLIVIPYTMSKDRNYLLSFIKKKLGCSHCLGRVDFSLFNLYKDRLSSLQRLANDRKGKCHAKSYNGIHSKILWECHKGHQWKATPASIKYLKTWCPVCVGLQRLKIEDFHEISRSRGGKCLSTRYINSKTKLRFQCKNKHVWSTIPSVIKRGCWCPRCVRPSRLRSKNGQFK